MPVRAVAALFLERQQLDRPRARRLTGDSLVRLAADTGGLQLDSIHVVDRAHHLTLWSRFGPFDRARLDRLVYRERRLFEYWTHCACLVDRAELPWWRHAMADGQAHRYARAIDRRTPGILERVERAVRASGPLGSADFEHRRTGSGGWWNWKPAQRALHALFFTGRLAVHSRVNFHKRYDLAERVLPEWRDGDPPDRAAFVRWHLARSLHAMGAATETDLRMYLTFPHIRPEERRRALASLMRDGEAVELSVEGDRARWFALARDLEALARAGRRRSASRGTTLLSPFDSFLWHRARIERLFGFEYRIEVYVPARKRAFGYYALPILHDGHLVGRLDAKTHRPERRLEVRRLALEPWAASGAPAPGAAWGRIEPDRLVGGIAGALGSLAAFVGADRVTLSRVAPARIASPLRRALADRVDVSRR